MKSSIQLPNEANVPAYAFYCLEQLLGHDSNGAMSDSEVEMSIIVGLTAVSSDVEVCSLLEKLRGAFPSIRATEVSKDAEGYYLLR